MNDMRRRKCLEAFHDMLESAEIIVLGKAPPTEVTSTNTFALVVEVVRAPVREAGWTRSMSHW